MTITDFFGLICVAAAIGIVIGLVQLYRMEHTPSMD